jgi:hypothetical protein
MTTGALPKKAFIFSLRAVGIFLIIMAVAMAISLVAKVLFVSNTIFVPYGLKVAVPAELLLIALASVAGAGCVKRSKCLGRYLGSIFCVVAICYFLVTGLASYRMAPSPILRIIFLEWLIAPAIVYSVVLLLINTKLRAGYEESGPKSA